MVLEWVELDQLSLQKSELMKLFKNSRWAPRNGQAGFSLLELLIATLVMVVGLGGAMTLILTAIANNSRASLDTTSTILSQMTLEMIASVPANAGSSVTVTDCNPSSSLASHTIDTAGNGSGAGAPLTSGSAIDFTQTVVSGYSMTFYSCQASTGDRQTLYDVRWNIKTLSADAKLVIVAARPSTSNGNANRFAVPASLKLIVGL